MSEVAAALARLGDLYRRLEEAAPSAACRACGACCHFEAYGHRLFATRLETLYLVERSGPPRHPFDEDSCGYQEGQSCAAREGRVLGCRTFFCPDAGADRRGLHESALDEIRLITEEFGLPWDYMPLQENVACVLSSRPKRS